MTKHKILTCTILFLIFILAACGETHIRGDNIALPNNSIEEIENIVKSEFDTLAQTLSRPNNPTVVAPRVNLTTSSGKVYTPVEFESTPLLDEINGALPIIVLYPFNLEGFSSAAGWNLSYWDFWNELEVVYEEPPHSTVYTLYDNYSELIYSADVFAPPPEVGEYVLRIVASWVLDTEEYYNAEYYIKIVIVEPRDPFCGNLDYYHGGSLGLVLLDGFHELLELDNHLPFSCTTDDLWSCPCFLQTEVDVQNLYSWLHLDKLLLPFSETLQLREILVRDRYADIYARYTLDDMIFSFNIHPKNTLNADEIVEGWHDNGVAQWYIERIATVGEANVYTETHNDDNPDVVFTLSLNGALVSLHVHIPCENPDICDRGADYGMGHQCNGEWVDRQAALDGLLQFEFMTLFH